MTQNLKALAAGNEMRFERARLKQELQLSPASEVVDALVNPTPEFASYRLANLFPRGGNTLIPRVGPRKLAEALRELMQEQPAGRVWHPHLRLRELTRVERERLAAALSKRAALGWRSEVAA